MDVYYATTPIYYVNAKPHLGHAYTTILVDAMRRFHQLMGEETRFLTGTDEHGDKIVKAASAAGESPQEYVDHVSGLFQEMLPHLAAQPDDFIRTTQKRHIACVQQILQKVHDSGDIYFGEYGGHYCYGCERFYTEKELEDGKCPQHGVKPEWIAEKNYFFKMSKYRDWLLRHIEKHPEFIRPEGYRNEVVSLLKSGELEDLCISRPKSRLSWGIELPFDKDYVCYVWFDALINYVSALGYPGGKLFKEFWSGANHFVAKDILKPHAVFWPTMLKAAGIEPYQGLNVHGYWLVDETKMSKSLGNVIEPLAMIDKYGLGSFRYFLLREMSFGMDASFSEAALIGRHNADLANDLGNLFNRSLAMTHKYFKGKVPNPGEEGPEDMEIKKLGREAMAGFQSQFKDLKFSRALESLWELVRGLNRYIDATAPWTLHKKGEISRLSAVIYTVLEHLRKVAVHLWPVMPKASTQMLEQLGVAFNPEKIVLTKEMDIWGVLVSGVDAAESSNLFPRLDMPELADGKAGVRPVPRKPAKGKDKKTAKPEWAEFSDFQKLDIRLGRITSAAPHPDADKLLLLEVDLGEDKPRQVVAGLAGHYGPADLPGRAVVAVVNLKPRKIRGEVSQAMLLTAQSQGRLSLLTAPDDLPPGAAIA
ncbi:MAG: methionine--tRNA ligase [Desulfovibrionaceae bacterium]